MDKNLLSFLTKSTNLNITLLYKKNAFKTRFLVHIKDKRMIILYAVPISLWPTLDKENRYFYTRDPNNNDRWYIST